MGWPDPSPAIIVVPANGCERKRGWVVGLGSWAWRCFAAAAVPQRQTIAAERNKNGLGHLQTVRNVVWGNVIVYARDA